eukprot:SAG31_NODE_1137_length_9727_cov_40.714894_7_plen_185_part_00
MLCGDVDKNLDDAGIDPNATPSLPEPLHLRKLVKHIIHQIVENAEGARRQNRWGITVAACCDADTQREESTFAKKRKKLDVTTRGGFKPKGRRHELVLQRGVPTSAIGTYYTKPLVLSPLEKKSVLSTVVNLVLKQHISEFDPVQMEFVWTGPIMGSWAGKYPVLTTLYLFAVYIRYFLKYLKT